MLLLSLLLLLLIATVASRSVLPPPSIEGRTLVFNLHNETSYLLEAPLRCIDQIDSWRFIGQSKRYGLAATGLIITALRIDCPNVRLEFVNLMLSGDWKEESMFYTAANQLQKLVIRQCVIGYFFGPITLHAIGSSQYASVQIEESYFVHCIGPAMAFFENFSLVRIEDTLFSSSPLTTKTASSYRRSNDTVCADSRCKLSFRHVQHVELHNNYF